MSDKQRQFIELQHKLARKRMLEIGVGLGDVIAHNNRVDDDDGTADDQ